MDINEAAWFFLDVTRINALIITLGKCELHIAQLKGLTPSLPMMIAALKAEVLKEYNVSKNRQTLELYERKWGSIGKIIH